MADVHDLANYREDEGGLSPTAVARALESLGGAAHRDAIADLVFAALPGRPAKPATMQAVDRILRMHAGEGGLFRQVFGPESYRWALTAGAMGRAADLRAFGARPAEPRRSESRSPRTRLSVLGSGSNSAGV